MAEQPIFFCENCGAEVPAGDSRCSVCHKGFAGVKCPRCLYQGSIDQFADGCPNCHYNIQPAAPKVDNQRNLNKVRRQSSTITFPLTAFIFGVAILLVIALYSYGL